MESALCNESVPDKNARFVVSGKQNAIYKEAAQTKAGKDQPKLELNERNVANLGTAQFCGSFTKEKIVF